MVQEQRSIITRAGAGSTIKLCQIYYTEPANVYVYSFHMNDNFQFQNSIKVANEVWWHADICEVFTVNSYWYSYPPQDAGSRKDLITPRLNHDLESDVFNGLVPIIFTLITF